MVVHRAQEAVEYDASQLTAAIVKLLPFLLFVAGCNISQTQAAVKDLKHDVQAARLALLVARYPDETESILDAVRLQVGEVWPW